MIALHNRDSTLHILQCPDRCRLGQTDIHLGKSSFPSLRFPVAKSYS